MTPTRFSPTRLASRLALAALVAAAGLAAPALLAAQAEAQVRTVRAYIPPDELVSFPAGTPMDEFVRLVNPTFRRVTGKSVVDPMDREDAIGVSLNGVHFIDAFELVLDRLNLDFRETEGYFIIEEPAVIIDQNVVSTTTDQRTVTQIDAGPRAVGGGMQAAEVSAQDREVRISAIIFQLNRSKAKEVGTNWASLFAQAGGTSTGGTTGGTSDENSSGVEFFVDGGSFFDALDGFLQASSDRVPLTQLLNLFRYFEELGYGQTISSPSVAVRSGQQGQMQSGEDIPINTRDFQGNTITQFISTGTIIDVKPTLIVEDVDGEEIEFIHLDVKVEKSSSRLINGNVGVFKNDVQTQVMLLDGEQTALGGLTSTEESYSRKGVPLLKDIPLLGYFFGYTARTETQQELVIVLQADVVDPLSERQGRKQRDMLDEARERVRDRFNRFNDGAGDRLEQIEALDLIETDARDR
ncbi:MAG TPA: type II and III secretion system protein [Bacteroidetes bacterium]|nr:type II and III secretion system protein [Bacteroidota bacterium]